MALSRTRARAMLGWVVEATAKDRALHGWNVVGVGGTISGAGTLMGQGIFSATPPQSISANVSFDGQGLHQWGLSVKQITGWLDLLGVDFQRMERLGGYTPYIVTRRRELPQVRLDVVVTGTDRADLLTKLTAIKQAVSPERGFCPMVRADVSDRRIYARCLGWPLDERSLPFTLRGVQFSLTFERLGFEEDITEQTAMVSASSGSITNGGDLAVDVAWVCTVSAALPGGLSFTVNGTAFRYTGALASGDVLTVHTEIQDVELGGVSVFDKVLPGAVYPQLAVGANAITLSDAGKFTLTARFYRRYE